MLNWLKKIRLNYTFSPHFRSKIWIWSLNSFLSQSGTYFGKFDPIKSYNGVKWGATCQLQDFLNFFYFFFELFFELFFLFFFIFLKFFKKLKFCHVSSGHCATWQWQCHVSLFGMYHFLILNLVPVFYFLCQFSPNFCKNCAILSLSKLKPNLISI